MRQVDILSAFSARVQRSATPLGAQTWRSVFLLAFKANGGLYSVPGDILPLIAFPNGLNPE